MRLNVRSSFISIGVIYKYSFLLGERLNEFTIDSDSEKMRESKDLKGNYLEIDLFCLLLKNIFIPVGLLL